MAEIRPRIVGTEMEWAINERLVGGEDFAQPERNLRAIVDVLPEGVRTTQIDASGMLSNGARYYLDINSHAEYATAEDTSFIDTVANEIAGEKIVIGGLQRYFDNNEKLEEVTLNKRVIDTVGETWGYHINLLADRRQIPRGSNSDLHLLGLHLATSLPILGSGALVRTGWRNNEEMWRYSLGQKINGIHHDFSTGTINSNKSLVNQRDEAHTSMEEYRRIHLTSMDAHISPWATWMALGSCSLILRAIEQSRGRHFRMTDATRDDPLLVLAKENSKDLTMKKVRAKIGGKTMHQFDIQRALLEIVQDTEHTDEETEVLDEWQRAVTDLEQDPKRLIGRSDTLTKYFLMTAHAEKHGEDPDDMAREFAYNFDLQYDELARLKRDRDSDHAYTLSIPGRLRQTIFNSHHPSQAIINERILSPPASTRASVRGKLIKTGTAQSANWSGVLTQNGTKYHFDDPYNSSAPTSIESPYNS